MRQHDDLEALLRRKAGDIGPGQDRPLSLADVRGRARLIRRRRRVVSGLAAAAVLAVAVPAGLTLTDGTLGGPDHDRNPPVASTSPSERPGSPTGSVDAGPTKHVLLTTNVEARGGDPTVPYLFLGGITLPDGSQVDLDRDYTALAPLGDGFVLVRDGFVDQVDRSGTVTRSMPGSGPLAVSADGTVVVYVGPDGELMTLGTRSRPLSIRNGDASEPVSPVSVIGSGTCKEGSPGGGCAVFYNVDGTSPEGRSVTSHGIEQQLPGFLAVGGLSSDGSLSGVTSIRQTGSCSVMLGRSWDVAWRTCDHTLGRFSPDGRYVLGYPAYRSGAGDPSVAILDARTGHVLVEYASDAKTQAYVHTAVWDTDGTVLATVFEHGSWSLMRMTPDGTLSSVSGGGLAGGSDPVTPPLLLPARP